MYVTLHRYSQQLCRSGAPNTRTRRTRVRQRSQNGDVSGPLQAGTRFRSTGLGAMG